MFLAIFFFFLLCVLYRKIDKITFTFAPRDGHLEYNSILFILYRFCVVISARCACMCLCVFCNMLCKHNLSLIQLLNDQVEINHLHICSTANKKYLQIIFIFCKWRASTMNQTAYFSIPRSGFKSIFDETRRKKQH